MRGRWLKSAVAVGWFLWTAVVIPGHTRGVIPLCGAGAGSGLACGAPVTGERPAACCPAGNKTAGEPGKDRAPAGSPRNCAICFLAAHLTHATPPPSGLDELGPVVMATPPSYDVAVYPAPAATHLIRGPPPSV